MAGKLRVVGDFILLAPRRYAVRVRLPDGAVSEPRDVEVVDFRTTTIEIDLG